MVLIDETYRISPQGSLKILVKSNLIVR